MFKLCAVSCYFNPRQYSTKYRNFLRFSSDIRRVGVPLMVVECASGESSFDLPQDENTIRVRARDVLWQKERLLNLAIAQVSTHFDAVAWLDCDVTFSNPLWAEDAAVALESAAVVQLYETAILLGKDPSLPALEEFDGFGLTVCRKRELLPDRHGHTGFAWAARSQLLREVGLYDMCLTGSADHLMAHGFHGDWDCQCVSQRIGQQMHYRDHFYEWCSKVVLKTDRRIGCVPGTLYHLWHGDRSKRRYLQQNLAFQQFDFNPNTDVRAPNGGCLEWASAKPELHKWAINYFQERDEDGTEASWP